MKSIMVVDDSKVVRKLILNILSKRQFSCIEAENGIEALEKLVTSEVDLIISDLNMPKMSGLELVKTIRSNELYNDIPVLMLTTETNQEDKADCLEAGVNVYLAKPLPPGDLLGQIDRLLG